MLLLTAITLTGFGFIAWATGVLTGYKGLAALGAVLVVGVGGVVLADGLEREAGTIERQINSTATEKIPQTTSIQLLPQTPTGTVWMLIGATMLLQGLNPND